MEMKPVTDGKGADGTGTDRPSVESATALRRQRERRQGRRHLWVQRRRRAASGLHVAAALILATLLTAMLNYAAQRYLPMRGNLSSLDHYTLSPKTHALLDGLRAEVRILPIFRGDNPLGDEVRRLLQEYEHAARARGDLALTVEPLDPDRDLVRIREVAARYDVTAADVVVVVLGARHRLVTEADLVDYDRLIDDRDLGSGKLRVEKQKRGFRGEQAISSALHGLALEQRPVVMFLGGHGERDLSNFSDAAGYGGLARVLGRENFDLRPLLLAESGRVPATADAVVIAGPTRQLAQVEVAALGAYLERSGRLLVLSDPGEPTGLEPLLEQWGVRLARDEVVGLTLTGRELFIREYGEHPITRPLKGMVTMFYGPRSVEPMVESAPAGTAPADRPRVTVLALTRDGWAEHTPGETPPRFDAGVDRPPPISVAAAVERGAPRTMDMELSPTRLVVIGDSDFVANGALREGVGANADFMIHTLNWLVDREALLEIAPRAPIDLRLDMDRRQARAALALMVLGVPSLAVLAGLAVWATRRR